MQVLAEEEKEGEAPVVAVVVESSLLLNCCCSHLGESVTVMVASRVRHRHPLQIVSLEALGDDPSAKNQSRRTWRCFAPY